jgi:uncharacterized protein
MILPDVNVLVYAHRDDSHDHPRYRNWLERTVNSQRSYAMSDLVLSGFLRIVTHPKIFRDPTPLDQDQSHCVHITAGDRFWGIFTDLLIATRPKGNHIPDAYLAALAIESGCEWITTDRDYARFADLHWRHPFDE